MDGKRKGLCPGQNIKFVCGDAGLVNCRHIAYLRTFNYGKTGGEEGVKKARHSLEAEILLWRNTHSFLQSLFFVGFCNKKERCGSRLYQVKRCVYKHLFLSLFVTARCGKVPPVGLCNRKNLRQQDKHSVIISHHIALPVKDKISIEENIGLNYKGCFFIVPAEGSLLNIVVSLPCTTYLFESLTVLCDCVM